MKFAFCFFGMNRCLSRTIGSIRHQLFRPLQQRGIEFEIHAAFMTPRGEFTNPRSGEMGRHPERDTANLLGAATVTLIDQEDFDHSFDFNPVLGAPDPWKDGYFSVRNICRALRSLEVVTESWNRAESDRSETVLFYLRPDLLYHDPLPVKQIERSWEIHRENLFLTPSWATHGGSNDRIACLGRNSALVYGNRIRQIAAYLQTSPQGMHAESFIRFIEYQIPGAPTQPALTLRASRVRTQGKIRVESFVNTSGKRLSLRWTLASEIERHGTAWKESSEQWHTGALRRVDSGRQKLKPVVYSGILFVRRAVNLFTLGYTARRISPAESELVSVGEIASDAWSGSSVNAVANSRQTILTHGNFQYAAYYDASARMILARRRLNASRWETQRTAHRAYAYDAHNSISLAVDGSGFLHVAWDHHYSGLNYAKSIAPESLLLSAPVPMTGQDEKSVTYPQFHALPGGDLVFLYRAGGSGDGSLVLNRYSVASRSWQRVQDQLIDGEGKSSPYWGATVDRQGVIHLGWIWRDSPDVATNHDIAYARSRDGGLTWTRSDDTACSLPITAASAEYAVRIPPNCNLMNSPMVATDENGSPHLVTYWSSTPEATPRFQIIWNEGNGWNVSPGPEQPVAFSLNGAGTKRPPLSRAIMTVDGVGAKRRVVLVYRDDRRGQRIIGAIGDGRGSAWQETELTVNSLGGWEPSIDPAAWERFSQIHLLVENVEQQDGNDSGKKVSWPRSIGVLQWSPFP